MNKAKLHNPIENCQKVVDPDGPVYGFGDSLVYFYMLEKKINQI